MNGIILDTSVIIAYEKGKFDLHAWLAKHSLNATVIATITVSELLYGIERDDAPARAQARRKWMDAFIATSTVLDFDENCARIHATTGAELGERGERIGAHDLLIAATALHHNMAVATLNAAEFKRVPNLKVITP
jgi:tRNA(fMet)-specific endonuclease VapC